MVVFVFFFFFQAEDGIRDRDVTGVQTCALPISRARRVRWPAPECSPVLGHCPENRSPREPASLLRRSAWTVCRRDRKGAAESHPQAPECPPGTPAAGAFSAR